MNFVSLKSLRIYGSLKICDLSFSLSTSENTLQTSFTPFNSFFMNFVTSMSLQIYGPSKISVLKFTKTRFRNRDEFDAFPIFIKICNKLLDHSEFNVKMRENYFFPSDKDSSNILTILVGYSVSGGLHVKKA